MPNVELVRAIFIMLPYVQVSSGMNHSFLSYCVHSQIHRPTDTQTDGHEYSIVAFDKLQLHLFNILYCFLNKLPKNRNI